MPGAFNYNFQTSKKGSAFQGPTAGLVYTSSTTAPINPTVGDLWFDTNNAILLVYVNDGSSSQWIETGSTNVGASSIQSNGRLTLESGVPVSTTNQTAKTTLYFTPYNGNVISLYDGTSWNAYTFSETSITTSGLSANSNYDVFAYVSGSTVTLEYSAAWTNDTTRSNTLSLLNGVYVKTINNTRRYLGTIRSNASAQFTDSLTNRLVWNFNNKVFRVINGYIYSLSHTYNGPTREYNGGVSVTRMYFITGLDGETFFANGMAPVTSTGTACNVCFAIDSITTQFSVMLVDDRAATFTRRSLTAIGSVGPGFHYLTALQNTESAGSATFYDFSVGCGLLC